MDGADGGGRSLRHAVPGPGRGDLEGPAPTFWLVPRAHTASWPCGPSRVFASQLVSGAGPPRPGDGGRPWLWGPVMAGWQRNEGLKQWTTAVLKRGCGFGQGD